MPVRSAVFESLAVAAESTPGVAAMPNRRLRDLGGTLQPELTIAPVQPVGQVAPAGGAQISKEQVTGRLEGPLAVNGLAYLLAAGLCTPAVATLGTTAKSYTYLPAQSNPDSLTTLTLVVGAAAGAAVVPGCVVQSLDIAIAQNALTVSADVLGRQYLEGSRAQAVAIHGAPTGGTFTLSYGGQTTSGIAFNATASAVQSALAALTTIGSGGVQVVGGPLPTNPILVLFPLGGGVIGYGAPTALTITTTGLTGGTNVHGHVTTALDEHVMGPALTEVAVRPLQFRQATMAIGPSVAGLTTLSSEDVLSVRLRIPQRFTPVVAINTDTSFSDLAERAIAPTVELVCAQGSAADHWMGQLRSGTVMFGRITVEGTQIEAGYNYRMRLTFPFLWTNPRRSDVNDVLAGTYDLALCYDSSLGSYLEAVLYTDMASL